MIELKNITKSYTMGDYTIHALKNVSITIEDGDYVAIMGPSGSGKSTLAHILGLLDVPNDGSYVLNGKEVSKHTEDELAILRRKEIGFIFQQFNLLPRMTAQENVALPLLYSTRNLNSPFSKELLDRVGLDTRFFHKPNELSGGQQQRVAIARSLINKPHMILADEPTGNLDSVSEKEILTILRELNEQGITVIIVTHEDEIGQQAKRLIRMRDGSVQSDERLVPFKGQPKSASEKQARAAELQDSFHLRDILEHISQGINTLAANKIRTALSMLGILIGVAAVVAMLAIGNGAQKAIEAQLATLGSNLLVLRPSAVRVGGIAQDAGSVTRLTIEDMEAVRAQIPLIKEASANVNGRGQVTHLDKNWSTQLVGAGPMYAEIHAAEPEIGRFFNEEENQKRSRIAVVGATVIREIFGDQNPIGEMIKINKVAFQVIGILPEKGMNGFRDQDDVIVVPVLTAMHRLMGKEYIDSMDLEVNAPENIEAAQSDVLALMYERKRIPFSQQDDAFQVRNMADIQAALTESSRTMSLLLASIAAISLLVGGIGIMNIMLVSVTERTKEIGLRKAIGAKRQDILLQFLAEAVSVSAIGGFIGIVIGWAITVSLSYFTGWATSISVESICLAFFFSAFIGIVFGIYPAKKASQLHPIDALRYE